MPRFRSDATTDVSVGLRPAQLWPAKPRTDRMPPRSTASPRIRGTACHTRSTVRLARLDQPLPDRVRDGVGPVAELEARRDVVDDVLDCSLRVEQLPPDLGRVVALGEQPEDRRLALRQARERQPARR